MKCNGKLENCGATTMNEYHDGECAVCSERIDIPTIWHEGGLWVKVPGYKNFYTCIKDGRQKLIPEDPPLNDKSD